MATTIGKCPNSDCRTEIARSTDVDKFLLTSLRDQHVYAIVCKACGVIIGTASQTRS
jgi:hypothetical protein